MAFGGCEVDTECITGNANSVPNDAGCDYQLCTCSDKDEFDSATSDMDGKADYDSYVFAIYWPAGYHQADHQAVIAVGGYYDDKDDGETEFGSVVFDDRAALTSTDALAVCYSGTFASFTTTDGNLFATAQWTGSCTADFTVTGTDTGATRWAWKFQPTWDKDHSYSKEPRLSGNEKDGDQVKMLCKTEGANSPRDGTAITVDGTQVWSASQLTA